MISSSNTIPSLILGFLSNAGSNYHPGYYLTANNGVYQAGAVAQFSYTELGLRSQQVVSGAWIREGRLCLPTRGCMLLGAAFPSARFHQVRGGHNNDEDAQERRLMTIIVSSFGDYRRLTGIVRPVYDAAIFRIVLGATGCPKGKFRIEGGAKIVGKSVPLRWTPPTAIPFAYRVRALGPSGLSIGVYLGIA